MNCSNDKSRFTARYTAKFFKIALLAVVGIAALGWLVMLLWNGLMPELFVGARQIGYWQALGVLLLSKILFGGGHGHGHGHGRWKEHRRRWDSMTPQEQEQLKGHFRSRWGHWCDSDKTTDTTTAKASTSHGE